MKRTLTSLAGGAVLASLLAACGGGDDTPVPTPADSLVTISAATNAAVVGTYTSGTTGLSDVEKENPVNAAQFCSFRFNGLARSDNSPLLVDGRVAYNVNQDLVNNFKVTVGSVTYGSGETGGTQVVKASNQVNVTNKVLTSEVDGVSTITVSARIPMKANRPDGC